MWIDVFRTVNIQCTAFCIISRKSQATPRTPYGPAQNNVPIKANVTWPKTILFFQQNMRRNNGDYSKYKGQNSTLMHPSYRWNKNSAITLLYVNRKIRSSCTNSFTCCVLCRLPLTIHLRESRYNGQLASTSWYQDPLKALDQILVLILKFIFPYEGKPEGKRTLGRPTRRWVDNIRTDLQEVGCGYMDWIGVAQDRDRWRTLYLLAQKLRYPVNTRLGGLQTVYGYFEERKIPATTRHQSNP